MSVAATEMEATNVCLSPLVSSQASCSPESVVNTCSRRASKVTMATGSCTSDARNHVPSWCGRLPKPRSSPKITLATLC